MKKANRIQILFIVILFTLLWFLTGCKSKNIYVPVESVKIEYRDKIQRDSIRLYDSIYFEKYLKGDTVFITKEKYKYLYRDKILKDSIFKVDSIRVPYPVIETKEVNKLKWYQEACIWFTSLVLIALALYLGVKYRGKILSLFRKLVFKI